MQQTATGIRVLVALSILLVVVGAQPGRAAAAPPRSRVGWAPSSGTG
jgi:hypothetical protein